MTDSLPDRHRFNPWRAPATPAMRAVVEEITAQVLNAESRERARKARDAETFRRTVEALVCDLAHRHLQGAPYVSVPRSERVLARSSRYRSAVLGKQLPQILDVMSRPEVGFIVQTKGKPSALERVPTIITAGPRLVSRLTGITPADITRREGEELIVLASRKDDEGVRSLVEYLDTSDTRRLRAEVQRINAALAVADISYTGPTVVDGYPVDARARHLTRRFTQSSFESGGRLWGGYWIYLPRDLRLAQVRIDGEPVVSLDFSGMVISTCYSLVGATPPDGDAYDLGLPTLARDDVLKPAACAFLYASRPVTRWPRDLAPYATVPWAVVREAFKARHPALAPQLFTGIGHRAQHIESNIMVEVLLRLIGEGITALPVHDAVVVAKSARGVAERIMREVFTRHTGLRAKIKPETAREAATVPLAA